MNRIVEGQLFMRTAKKWLVVLAVMCFLTACQKNQDDVELPIYDSIGGDFTLSSSLGRDVSLSEFKGRVVLINFGFTHCMHVCPMVMARLSKLTEQLESQHQISIDKVQTLFITIDPERDDVKRLKEFLKTYNEDFVGLTGTVEQTTKVSKQYASFVQKEEGGTEDNYQMIHNDKIFLIDKRGRLRALYGKETTNEKVISDIASLVKADI